MAYKPTQSWAAPDEAAAVTPSDTVNLPGIPSQGARLWIGVSGDVTVDMATGGTNITFKGAPAGPFPYLVRKVYATGTTATNIVAAW